MTRLIICVPLILLATTSAAAQQALPLGIESSKANAASYRMDRASTATLPEHGTPRWAKAATIGAVTSGLGFALLHVMFQQWNPQNSMAHDLTLGIVGGAVAAGSAVALYDWICTPGSASDNAGLCTPLPRRRFPDASRRDLIPHR